MEGVLREDEDMSGRAEQVQRGLQQWHLKMQRAAEKNFDKFEVYAHRNIFALPENLQLAPPEATATEEDARLEAEADGLWAQLQQALATKRTLERKLAAAQQTTALWESHRESVQQLAASHEAGGVENALNGAQQLSATLQGGWQLLESADGARGPARAAAAAATTGPRGLQQRYSQRRAQISTVGVPDLAQLSSLLAAS